MRPLMRSSAPLRKCGPGTSTMHGQTATGRRDDLRSYRTASARTMPARAAAQNGCRKRLRLSRPKARRNNAPATAPTTTVGLDIAKSVFQVHGDDAGGNVVFCRQLKRRYVVSHGRYSVPWLLTGT